MELYTIPLKMVKILWILYQNFKKKKKKKQHKDSVWFIAYNLGDSTGGIIS